MASRPAHRLARGSQLSTDKLLFVAEEAAKALGAASYVQQQSQHDHWYDHGWRPHSNLQPDLPREHKPIAFIGSLRDQILRAVTLGEGNHF